MRCEHSMPNKTKSFVRFRPCKKAASVQRNEKWYCSLHDPIQIRIKIQEVKKPEKKKENIFYLNTELASRCLMQRKSTCAV